MLQAQLHLRIRHVPGLVQGKLRNDLHQRQVFPVSISVAQKRTVVFVIPMSPVYTAWSILGYCAQTREVPMRSPVLKASVIFAAITFSAGSQQISLHSLIEEMMDRDVLAEFPGIAYKSL